MSEPDSHRSNNESESNRGIEFVIESDETPDWARLDRDRGILTPEDRKFLLGEKSLGDSAERNARFRVRKRLQNAFHDLQLLSSDLSQNDRQQVFENLTGDFIESGAAIDATVSLIYQGLADVADGDQELDRLFREKLSTGIGNIERSKGRRANVTFNVDRKEPDTDQLRNKIAAGNATVEDFSLYMTSTGDTELIDEFVEREEDLQLRIGDETISFQVGEEEGDNENR